MALHTSSVYVPVLMTLAWAALPVPLNPAWSLLSFPLVSLLLVGSIVGNQWAAALPPGNRSPSVPMRHFRIYSVI